LSNILIKFAKLLPLLLLIIPCVFGWLGYTGHGFIFKALVAGSGILFLLFFYRKDLWKKKDVWCIVAAFIFSIVGDWFLANRHGGFVKFIWGILFFFFAHMGYLGYSLLNGHIKWIFTAVILVVYLTLFGLVFYPSIDEPVLITAVLAYMSVSCFSLGAAAGIKYDPLPKWIFFLGITMLLFSDTIIAFKEFSSFKELNFLILPTYYLSQISVMMALMINKLNLSLVCSETE